MSFKDCVFLLIFCLSDLTTAVNGVLKSPTVTVLLSTSPFMFVNIRFMYLGAPTLGAYVFTIIISSYWIDSFIIM